MTGPAPKQLTLDYFAGRLLTLKNDVDDGRIDPLVPLQAYIEEFTRLQQERRDSRDPLQEFVSTFSVLRELVESKVQAFKLRVLAFDQDGIKRYLATSPDMEQLVAKVPWRDPFDLCQASMPFMRLVLAGLGKERVSLPPLGDFMDEEGDLEISWPLPSRTFTRELEQVIAYLHEHPGEAGIQAILDGVAQAFEMPRVKAFVMLLHLIQDGTVRIPSEDGPVTTVAVPAGGDAR